jgi:hypothetical protein
VTTGAQSSADTCNQQNSQHRSDNYATHGRLLLVVARCQRALEVCGSNLS